MRVCTPVVSPDQSFLAYCPSIESRAKGGSGGWTWVTRTADGKPGDLALYTEPDAPSNPAHVELVVKVGLTLIDVIGGNTAPAPDSGNQSNGGTVAENSATRPCRASSCGGTRDRRGECDGDHDHVR